MLTRELKSLLLLDSRSDTEESNCQINIGETVVINNSYQGLKGATGTVLSISPSQQVTIKLKINQVVQRKNSNIMKIFR